MKTKITFPLQQVQGSVFQIYFVLFYFIKLCYKRKQYFKICASYCFSQNFRTSLVLRNILRFAPANISKKIVSYVAHNEKREKTLTGDNVSYFPKGLNSSIEKAKNPTCLSCD